MMQLFSLAPTRRAISHQGMTVEELEDLMDLME